MPLIQVPVGTPPCQIDDFPAEVKSESGKKRPFERSHKGSLHLRPASTKVVTQDELDFLKAAKQHQPLGRRLVVVPVDVVPDKSNRPHAEPRTKPLSIKSPTSASKPDKGGRKTKPK